MAQEVPLGMQVANAASLIHSSDERKDEGDTMSIIGLILLILVIMMLLGSAPVFPHSRNWGYGPSGGVGLILLILVILLVLGRI